MYCMYVCMGWMGVDVCCCWCVTTGHGQVANFVAALASRLVKSLAPSLARLLTRSLTHIYSIARLCPLIAPPPPPPSPLPPSLPATNTHSFSDSPHHRPAGRHISSRGCQVPRCPGLRPGQVGGRQRGLPIQQPRRQRCSRCRQRVAAHDERLHEGGCGGHGWSAAQQAA